MDNILLLLMHQPRGLKIQPEEMCAILKSDPHCPRAVSAPLQNTAALGYLARCPDWIGESQRILDESQRAGVRWCRIGEEDYPKGWLALSERPYVFSYRGDPVWNKIPLLAVVGSRTPMEASRLWMQRELGRFLKDRHAAVVSGGARGVDQWAHRISMNRGKPTVCVLPSGVLNPYPPEKHEFWQEILSGGGCLLSTFALKAPMGKMHFEIRNRWIVGFSPCLFVVESNRRSGSSLTARLAKDENREIGTLPVAPYCEQGLNNLDLISDGAQMLRDHRDLSVLWDRNLTPNFF